MLSEFMQLSEHGPGTSVAHAVRGISMDESLRKTRMKPTTQFLRAQIQQVCALERTGPNYDSRTVGKTPFARAWYLPAAALMTLICLADRVSAQLDGMELATLSGDISEYCSTDTPKAIPDKDTTISQLTVSDTGEIVDLNIRVRITHNYDGSLDIFLIAPDGTRVELFTDIGGQWANFDDTILELFSTPFALASRKKLLV